MAWGVNCGGSVTRKYVRAKSHTIIRQIKAIVKEMEVLTDQEKKNLLENLDEKDKAGLEKLYDLIKNS